MLISDEHCPETAQKARRDAFTGERFNISSNTIFVPLKLIITHCSYKWPNKAHFYNMFVALIYFFQSCCISTIFLLMFFNYFYSALDRTALWKCKFFSNMQTFVVIKMS